jgi:hypothetical protein
LNCGLLTLAFSCSAISIQPEGKKLLEKHAIAPSAARLCSIARLRKNSLSFDSLARVGLHEQPHNGSKHFSHCPDGTNDGPLELTRNRYLYRLTSRRDVAPTDEDLCASDRDVHIRLRDDLP